MDHTRKQVALVLQGGGALGAYEAGTYQEIYKHANQHHPDGRLFDIIAGTSIGAINSSILLGHYIKNGNNWEGSDRTLLDFWQGLASPTIADALIGGNSAVSSWWNNLHSINPSIADAETARRFWSIFEFSFTTSGVPHMYQPYPLWGTKFLNPFTDFLPWWRYDYERLREYLSKFVDFPIKTSLEEGQPRLLLTSVDVQDYTAAVVFDSYRKLHVPFQYDSLDISEKKKQEGDGMWFSEYGTADSPHVVFYDGIGPDHVLASALGKYSLKHPTIEDAVTKTNRELWDGGYLSNTPLRELLASHRKYWNEYLKNSPGPKELTQIPELEVYVVNLHPAAASDIPVDKDLIDNRENDILFHDRTAFDEMVAYLRTDYVDLAWKLIELATSQGRSSDVDKILKEEAKSIARAGGEFRYFTYRDIIDGRTKVSKVWRIDRQDSSTALFGKTTDFTASSIRGLISAGQKDATISLNRMKILFAIEELISDGIVSAKEGEDAMSRVRRLVTGEELYKKSHAEILEAYERLLTKVKQIVPVPERRQAVSEPARIIVEFLTGTLNSKAAQTPSTQSSSSTAS
ncbi:MAG TPA: patatin-like phospholipase family protein [Nitrososphaera sp.]|nr:patatin-like phospholipase family protein [Nitrososphaera sp.]